MDVRIGTAGWAIPRTVRDRFPNASSVLARYAQRFDAVEINSSFYRPHRRSTYERWAASVPDRFRFAVKLPKAITHEKRLQDAESELDRFFDETSGLGAKLGPTLIQLPPSLSFDRAIVAAFLRSVRSRSPGPLVCEPRHATWFSHEPDELLRDHAVSRVAADPALVPDAARFGGFDGLRYLRLHGAPRLYYSDYPPDRLAVIAADLVASPVETWCMFDNTALGAACANALAVRATLGLEP